MARVNIKVKCPDCARSIALGEVSTVADMVRVRTCRGCRAKWQIVIRPLPCRVEGMHIHTADFARCAF